MYYVPVPLAGHITHYTRGDAPACLSVCHNAWP